MTTSVSGQPFGESSRSLIGKNETTAIIDSLRQLLNRIDCPDSCFKFIRLDSFMVSLALDEEVTSILLMSEEHGSMFIRKYLNRVVIQDRLEYYDGYYADGELERLHLRGEFINMVFERRYDKEKVNETWVERSDQLNETHSKIIVGKFLRMVP